MKILFVCLTLVIFLTSCGRFQDTTGISFEDFEREVIAYAGENAFDCGYVPENEDRTELTQCVIDHYLADDAHYAIYDLQGIDSYISAAVAYNSSSELYFLYFDSDPTGGARRDNGFIEVRKCIDPQIDGDQLGGGLFNCASTVVVAQRG